MQYPPEYPSVNFHDSVDHIYCKYCKYSIIQICKLEVPTKSNLI